MRFHSSIMDASKFGCFVRFTNIGLPPDRICQVGDAGGYDADGAAAAGMLAVHVDPLGLCPDEHTHVTSLADFAAHLLDGT